MPRPKKNDGSSVQLISDTISPDTPIPDLSALGDLALPITFPEDRTAEQASEVQVQKRHRGRPRKVRSEESEVSAPVNLSEPQEVHDLEIHSEEAAPEIAVPTSELSGEPVITATPGTSELTEENQGSLPNATENVDMNAAMNNPALNAPMPDAPFGSNGQNQRRYNNGGNRNFDYNNARHGKYNKFGRGKYGRNNRFLPQDDLSLIHI